MRPAAGAAFVATGPAPAGLEKRERALSSNTRRGELKPGDGRGGTDERWTTARTASKSSATAQRILSRRFSDTVIMITVGTRGRQGRGGPFSPLRIGPPAPPSGGRFFYP